MNYAWYGVVKGYVNEVTSHGRTVIGEKPLTRETTVPVESK